MHILILKRFDSGVHVHALVCVCVFALRGNSHRLLSFYKIVINIRFDNVNEAKDKGEGTKS